MNKKIKVEYIWLDGNHPEPSLRSKTKIIEVGQSEKVSDIIDNLPEWSYDGSSTKQAEGRYSDCILKPCRVIPDPQRKEAFLVMCEVYNPDGTPHKTNTRHLIENDTEENWYGFEQEYTITRDDRPIGFPERGYPDPQGPYYCAVGYGNVAGRSIAEQHLDICLNAGLNITGINAEVLLGQWEYQLLGKGAKTASDDLWLSRYLLHRICENKGYKVDFHPKPVKGDWNGSGLHTNFSNKEMREEGGETYIKTLCEIMKSRHSEFIKDYGSNNEERLTGSHETNHISRFNAAISDRGASIRIPIAMVNNGWKGYLEDRRPASNADPYKITRLITDVLKVKGTVDGYTPSTVTQH
jgi:glutamine synthetase